MSTAPFPTTPAPDAEPSDPDLSGTIFAFTPVPMARVRARGWSPLALIDAKQCEVAQFSATSRNVSRMRKVGFIGELW